MTQKYAFRIKDGVTTLIPVRVSYELRFSVRAIKQMMEEELRKRYQGVPDSLAQLIEMMEPKQWYTADDLGRKLGWKTETAQRRLNYVPERASHLVTLEKRRYQDGPVSYRIKMRGKRKKT